MHDGLFVAARRVRPFLPDLIPDRAEEVDAQFAELLNSSESEGAHSALLAVFRRDAALEMFLDAVQDDPEWRPPQVADYALRGPGYSGLPGSQVPPDPDLYHCPDGDFEWYRPGLGTPVPRCPTHHRLLVRS